MASAKSSEASASSFTLSFVSADGACARCQGLPTLNVLVGSTLIGRIVSDWPWNVDIPADPSQHPTAPHYAVEYSAETVDGVEVPTRAADLYYVARSLYDHHKRSQRSRAA